MASVFSKIIAGELPAHFVYRDDVCVAFMSIEPLREGHVLVVPNEEIDHWLDLGKDTIDHLMGVAQRIGGALQLAYPSEKVGLMLAGLEVPHVHIHLVPIDAATDLDFVNAASASAEDLAAAAERISDALNR